MSVTFLDKSSRKRKEEEEKITFGIAQCYWSCSKLHHLCFAWFLGARRVDLVVLVSKTRIVVSSDTVGRHRTTPRRGLRSRDVVVIVDALLLLLDFQRTVFREMILPTAATARARTRHEDALGIRLALRRQMTSLSAHEACGEGKLRRFRVSVVAVASLSPLASELGARGEAMLGGAAAIAHGRVGGDALADVGASFGTAERRVSFFAAVVAHHILLAPQSPLRLASFSGSLRVLFASLLLGDFGLLAFLCFVSRFLSSLLRQTLLLALFRESPSLRFGQLLLDAVAPSTFLVRHRRSNVRGHRCDLPSVVVLMIDYSRNCY